MDITKASLVLEINGKPHIALLDGVNIGIMCNLIAVLTDGGTLKVVKAPDSFRFENLSEHLTTTLTCATIKGTEYICENT
jgi:hypothetical protein